MVTVSFFDRYGNICRALNNAFYKPVALVLIFAQFNIVVDIWKLLIYNKLCINIGHLMQILAVFKLWSI